MSVTAPVPDGVAMEVPLRLAYPVVPGPTEENSAWPGLQNVGLRRPSAVGPRLVGV
jgi:hypothetical protein